MKSTGIVRKIDALGRLVIPKELRDDLHLECGDGVSILTEGGSIVLTPHRHRCIFCGSSDDLTKVNEVPICPECAKVVAGRV